MNECDIIVINSGGMIHMEFILVLMIPSWADDNEKQKKRMCVSLLF